MDQAALLAALRGGQLGGAAIDTHDPEPMAEDDPIRHAPNTILTPHLGYVTQQNVSAYFTGAVTCLRAWNAGETLPRPLNRTAQSFQGSPA